MNNESLNDNVKKILEGLMSQEGIDNERKFLEDNGVTVDEKVLTDFHEKKEEILEALKERRDKLKKLDAADLENIDGGGITDILSKVKDMKETLIGKVMFGALTPMIKAIYGSLSFADITQAMQVGMMSAGAEYILTLAVDKIFCSNDK